jgi:hypothetical protein
MDKLIENHRDKIRELAKTRGAKNISLFGSMARNQASATSDVDFLVEMEKGQSAFALGSLLMDLQDLLGRKVDVVTPNSLHSAIRDRILREATEL